MCNAGRLNPIYWILKKFQFAQTNEASKLRPVLQYILSIAFSGMIRLPFVFVLFFVLTSDKLSAQQPATGFNREILSSLDKKLNNKKNDEHSSIQPAAYGLERSYQLLVDSNDILPKKKNVISANLFGSLAGGFQFAKSQKTISSAVIGTNIEWTYSDKWHAIAGYALVGEMPADYIQNLADTFHFIPGSGYAVKDADNLYHSHYTYGHLSYNEGKHFQFEIGKGKQFWGDGYRSLILSDNANAYPYLRLTTKVWKIKYTNLWMQMRDISQGQLRKDARIKYTALHALSLNVTNKLNFSIYEMVVWQDKDTMNYRTLDINYLNPIIFYRPVEYSVGSPDNVILAASLKYKIKPNIQLYGQFILDEFNLAQFKGNKKWWANKLGGQIGLKFFDVFIPNLHVQSEMNIARPFTYTHGSPIQSWTHLNQSLAHPMGSNFMEWVSFIRYSKGKWSFLEQFTWAAFGRDRDMDSDGVIDNLGGNILKSYKDPYRKYGNEMLQGLKSNFYFHSFTLSRKLSESGPFEVFLNHCLRYEENDQTKNIDHFFLVGIRSTGLLQTMRDY